MKAMLSAIRTGWFGNGPLSAIYISLATVFSILLYLGVTVALTIGQAPIGVDQSLDPWSVASLTIMAIALAAPHLIWRWYARRTHRQVGKQWKLFMLFLFGFILLNWIGMDMIGQSATLALLVISFSSAFLLSRLPNLAYAPAMILTSIAVAAIVSSVPAQAERGYTLYSLTTGEKIDHAFCPLGVPAWCSERFVPLEDPIMDSTVSMVFPVGTDIDGWKSDTQLILKKTFTVTFRPESTTEREQFQTKFPVAMIISAGTPVPAALSPGVSRTWNIVRNRLVDSIGIPDGLYRIDLIEQ